MVWALFAAVPKNVVSPEKHLVEPGRVGDPPADPIVPETGGLVEGTGADAVGTIAAIVGPELQAGFGIDVPDIDPFAVGNIVRFR